MMTRETIEMAQRTGIPFVLKMADGHSYEVRAADKIAIGPDRVAVEDEQGIAHVLRLLTMTGINYLAKQNRSQPR